MRVTTRSPATPRPARRSRYRASPALAAGAAAVVMLCAAAGPAAAAPVVLAVATSLNQVADNLRNWLIAILATIATTYLTVGGARYLLSGGDAGEVERAKACLRSAMIGYCLAILAPVVVSILKSLVGG
ncbi:pilin [Nocardia sp. CA2R105]|uniref:pilin n=1 Tax=Nocardia coffeae TaxID=2873381 RepID=UPI001CA6C824|nr:pilin [Nocardia coffeae]MBY8855364.1 pilin [Nocardia coffeae]